MVARGKNQEQQLQGPRKAYEDKTDSYGLDRRHVIPQEGFSDFQLPITWAAWVGHRLAKILNRKNRL